MCRIHAVGTTQTHTRMCARAFVVPLLCAAKNLHLCKNKHAAQFLAPWTLNIRVYVLAVDWERVGVGLTQSVRSALTPNVNPLKGGKQITSIPPFLHLSSEVVNQNDSIHYILHVRRRACVPPVELRRRLYLTRMPALLVQRRLRWFANTTSYVAQASWRPAEDVGNHDQGRPRTPLRTASLRLRTMEKGLGKSL